MPFLRGASTAMLLAIFFLHQFRIVPRNSDEASSLLAGYDMAHGNFLLSGWTLPPDSYWLLDDLLYGVMTRFVDVRPALLYVLPAAIWTSVVILALLLSRAGRQGARHYRLLIPAILLILPPFAYGDQLSAIGDAPDHVLTLACSLLGILLAVEYVHGPDRRGFIAPTYTALVFVTTCSDPFGLVVFVAPAMMVLLYNVVHDNDRRASYRLIGLTLAAWLAARLCLAWVGHLGGFRIGPEKIAFCDLQDVPRNVLLFIQIMLTLFGADFFSKSLAGLGGAIPNLVRLPLLMLAAVAVVRQLAALRLAKAAEGRADIDMISVFCAGGAALTALAAIASSYFVNTTSIRYLVPVLVFAAILCARSFGDDRRLAPLLALEILSALVLTFGLPRGNPASLDSPGRLAGWLREHDLHDGYGGHWDASITTVTSRDAVRVRPIIRGGSCGLQPFDWLSTRRWYYQAAGQAGHATFVVVRPAQTNFFTADDVLRALGKPHSINPVGNVLIYVYGNAAAIRDCLGR